MPTYNELVLVANEDALERDADKLRAFIGALSRGTRDLRSNPGEAIEGLLDANPDLDAELQRAVVDVTLPLFFPPEGKPFGWQSPSERDAPSRRGSRTTACWRTRPTRARPMTTSSCPAQASDSSRSSAIELMQ